MAGSDHKHRQRKGKNISTNSRINTDTNEMGKMAGREIRNVILMLS